MPTSIKEVQAFLGFANFYCQFISNFSRISQLLVDATKETYYTTKSSNKKVKYSLFKWIEARQKAFKNLKQAFIMVPELAHYNLALEIWIKTDASEFVIGGVLS